MTTTTEKPMQKCYSIIVSGKVQDISIDIDDLPDNFTKASYDDEIDIGRKLDKANVLLKSGFDNLNTDLNRGFDNLNRDLNRGFNNMTTIMSENNTRMDEHNTRLEAMMYEQNVRLDAHNTRLEAILEKLVNKS